MSKETLQQELESIEAEVNAYFDKVEASKDSEDRVPPSDVSQRLASVVSELHSITGRSSLFDELDQNTLRDSFRCADAALRLHRYQRWEKQVLHDEDIFLGVTEAGHGEYPIDVSDSREEFREGLDYIRRILVLIPDDNTSNPASPIQESQATEAMVEGNTFNPKEYGGKELCIAVSYYKDGFRDLRRLALAMKNSAHIGCPHATYSDPLAWYEGNPKGFTQHLWKLRRKAKDNNWYDSIPSKYYQTYVR